MFQPTHAAYLNLIEPWWKALRRLALKGRRFETWGYIRIFAYAAAEALAIPPKTTHLSRRCLVGIQGPEDTHARIPFRYRH